MINGGKRSAVITLSDFSGGINTYDPPSKITENMVTDSINFCLNKNIKKRCGSIAVSDKVADKVYGMDFYIKGDGTQLLVAKHGTKWVSINTTTGNTTDLYSSSSTKPARAVNYLNSLWCCDGVANIRVEDTTAYKLGITAPVASGSSVSAVAGGTLPDGIYGVYVAYARKSGSSYLFSSGYSLGNVTCGTGSNTITVAVANSADPQVTHKVVFLTDAGGTIHYYYGEATNATATVSIASNANRDVTLIYAIESAPNTVPIAFDHILAHDNRIWGATGNYLYYSLQTTANPFDLQRFTVDNYLYIPHTVTGLFAIENDIYVNTANGIVRIPDANVSTKYENVSVPYPFLYIDTVVTTAKGVIGLTRNGLRIFTGKEFLEYPISRRVSSIIAKILTGATSFTPKAILVQRSDRVEYHLGYCDISVNTATSNRRLVLNVDKLNFYNEQNFSAPFELWSCGASDFSIDASGSLYSAQSHATKSIIYKEITTTFIDNGIYKDDGSIASATYSPLCSLTTRHIDVGGDAIAVWYNVLMNILALEHFTTILYLVNGTSYTSTKEIGAGYGITLWDEANFDESLFSREDKVWVTSKKDLRAKGRVAYVKIENSTNDMLFEVTDIVLKCNIHKGRFTISGGVTE
jgi:hypothetical protein